MSSEEPGRTLSMVRMLDRGLSDEERASLIRWTSSLLEIRASDAPARTKARQAVRLTVRADAIRPVVTRLAGALRDVIWTDRSWAARFGLGAATLTAATFGSTGAGIAAFGTAIGLPLWMVLGAGGSFAGMLLDELLRSQALRRVRGPSDGEADVVEAEWTFATGPEDAGPLPLPAPEEGSESAPAEPLWHVFRRAYRGAHRRQEETARPLSAAADEPPQEND